MKCIGLSIAAAFAVGLSACGGEDTVKSSSIECTGTIQLGVNILSNGCRFVYESKNIQVKSVVLTGDFMKWTKKGKPMTYNSNTGYWSVIHKLDPGVYQYLFIINGTNWVCDPLAIANVPDGTYGKVSVIEVNEP
ncbi:MAG: hypothetical protein C4557_11375 [Anaerolineaceae bacterium]|jgi:1,4-alpha-glucan branching enzyme|nr:MAG: hypothetical protein C4557_11375 [Anaerolineaceae bacterium]